MKKTIIYLTLITLTLAKISWAELMEIKALPVSVDSTTQKIQYELPVDCLVRTCLKIKGGPIIHLGEAVYKKPGSYEEKTVPLDKNLNPEKVEYLLRAYKTAAELKEKTIEPEKDLALNLKYKKPRLGQYIADYQKNKKKIEINLKNKPEGLYTVKIALDNDVWAIERNVTLPYLWEFDFKIYPPGEYYIYIEVCGGDNAVGIGKLKLQVI